MLKTWHYKFMQQLEKYDFIVQSYGKRFSSARYNGVYYDTIQIRDKDVFAEYTPYTLVKTIGNVKVYRKRKE